ncbi:MAG: response regulator [Myxococcales bacterium]|nr:response regulator [Myxococcales bacterium]
MSDKSKLDCPCSPHVGIAVRASGMGIWRLSLATGLFSLNERSCEIHELDMGAEITLQLEEYLALIHPDDRWKVESIFRDDSPKSFRELEFRLADPVEGPRWVRLSGDVERDGDGSAVEVVGSCFDTSERMMVHRQLLQAQKMEAVGQLTAGIAHNFNNILSAILPSLHLATPHVKPEGAKLVRNAQLAAERATGLVAELMVVAGRKTGHTRKALELTQIVDRVVRICRTTFGGWIQLNVDCDFELPPLLANESQLEQVLLNLLLNARDAFEESSISYPRVDMELEVEDEEVVLRVLDNGPGMDAATLQRVFEPFFTTKGSGTGLGLATAYAIVGEHGGSIECWSKPSKGTEFVLRFPVHAGAVESLPDLVEPVFVGGNERILVVDDDPLVRRVTSAALRDAGYEVLEAKGGDEAITTQRADELIDLIVLDMAMPEITGDLVLKAMRTKDSAVKVLVFTGLSDARVERLRDVAILQKPAGVNELLQAVRGAIDNHTIN